MNPIGMSRGALIVIVTGIIVAAIAAGVVVTTERGQPSVPEGMNTTEGKQLTLNLNENLALKENP